MAMTKAQYLRQKKDIQARIDRAMRYSDMASVKRWQSAYAVNESTWARTSPAAAPAGPADVRAAQTATTARTAVRAAATTAAVSTASNYQQALDLLRKSGVDVSNPKMAALLHDPVLQANLLGPQGPLYIQQYAATYPLVTPTVQNYQAVLNQYHLYGHGTQTVWSGGHDPHQTVIAGPNPQGSPYTDPASGAVIYGNGVIFVPGDPSNPNPIFAPGSDVPGSPLWIKHVGETWTPDMVTQWRIKLANLGYVVGDLKSGTTDQGFLGALSQYWADHYKNFGKEIPTGLGVNGAGKPFDFNKMKAVVRGDVQKQYQAVFGNLPSGAEEDHWTQFVINTANKLQSAQAGGLTAGPSGSGGALDEASAQLQQKFQQSPQAPFAVDPMGNPIGQVEQENTSLHDSLTAAVQAAAGVMR